MKRPRDFQGLGLEGRRAGATAVAQAEAAPFQRRIKKEFRRSN